MARIRAEVDLKDVYDMQEACKLLGITRQTMTLWVKEGKLHKAKAGTPPKDIFFKSEIDKMRK